MLIAILALPNVVAMEVVGLRDTFDEARRQSGDPDLYEVKVVAETAGPMQTSSGLRITPDLTIEEADVAIDTLAIAGGYGAPAPPSAALGAWILRQVPRVRRYGSVCTGGFALGYLGLLDGRRVTTHWDYAAQFAEAFPKMLLERDHIFLRDGPLFSSAGITSSIDLALSLVEEDCGRDLALKVARRLVLYLKRSGGEPQVSVHLAAQLAMSTQVQRAQAWARDHPAADLSVGALARRVAMSPRNFARVFREESGMTPGEFVERARLEDAQRLLGDTDFSLQRVALASGFRDSQALRRAFKRRRGVTPMDYRDRLKLRLK